MAKEKPAVVLLTEDQIKAFDDQFGDTGWTIINGTPGKDGKPEWQIAFRKPTRVEFKRFRADATDAGKRAESQERLVRACLVHPGPTQFDALLEEYPAICDSEETSAAIKKMTGMASEAYAK